MTPHASTPCDEPGAPVITVRLHDLELVVLVPATAARCDDDALDRQLAALGMTKVYVPTSTLCPPGNDDRARLIAERDRATRDAEASRCAIELLTNRMFVRRSNPRPPPPAGAVSPPKIDDIARAKAKRALRRGGLIGGKK